MNNCCDALWFLSGDDSKASSRLHGSIISSELDRLNFPSSVLYRRSMSGSMDFEYVLPLGMNVKLDGTVSVIQKLYGENTDFLIDWLRNRGSTIVYLNCDIREKNNTWRKADVVLVTSSALARYHRARSNIPVHTVFDPFEYSQPPEYRSPLSADSRLKVIWFGDRSNWDSLVPWKRILESDYADRVELITISNHPEATRQWTLEGQRDALQHADIGVVPVNSDDGAQAKSANRLTQLLAMGIPAIVGNLEAYREVRDQGIPVFIADGETQFRFALEALFDARHRSEVARRGYQMTIGRFSPVMAARRWMDALEIDVPCYHPLSKARAIARVGALKTLLHTASLAARIRRRLAIGR